MPSNPFAPPEAPLADPETPPRAVPPAAVRQGCFLLFLSFVLSLVTLWPGMRPPTLDGHELSWPVLLTVTAVVLAGSLWLLLKNYQGRNWARWTLFAYLALGWWLVGADLQENFAHSPLTGAIDLACVAIEMRAGWLLMVGEGARWFLPRPRAGH
jgi:hypothetical protein